MDLTDGKSQARPTFVSLAEGMICYIGSKIMIAGAKSMEDC